MTDNPLSKERVEAAIKTLSNHQKWRKGCHETPAQSSKELSTSIDAAIAALEAAEKGNQPRICWIGNQMTQIKSSIHRAIEAFRQWLSVKLMWLAYDVMPYPYSDLYRKSLHSFMKDIENYCEKEKTNEK